MVRYEIVPSRRWYNQSTGASASIFGSTPWASEADRNHWQIVQNGWTIRDEQTGTVGMGREPFATHDSAQQWLNALLAYQKTAA